MGLINYPERARQVVDFDNILPPPLAPTDIDGLIEWKNKAYVIFEMKRKGVELPLGQKIAIERIVEDFKKAGKPSIAIVLEHTVLDSDDVVYAAECEVKSIYFNGNWYRMSPGFKPKDVVYKFLLSVDANFKKFLGIPE